MVNVLVVVSAENCRVTSEMIRLHNWWCSRRSKSTDSLLGIRIFFSEYDDMSSCRLLW